MEFHFTKYLNQDSYLKKLKYEINYIHNLTEKILIQIESETITATSSTVNKTSHWTGSHMTVLDVDEELYRKIKTFLVTLNQYIQTISQAYKHSVLPAFVGTPDHSSLPSVCTMMWKHVEAMCRTDNYEKMAIDQYISDQKDDRTMLSKIIQTENSCLTYCESCHMSTGLVKSLVRTILSEQRKYGVQETHVSAFRKSLGAEIFEVSQWEVMNRWVMAIQEDVKHIVAITVNTHNQCMKLLRSQYTMKKEQENIVKTLTNNLTLARTQLEAEKAQSDYYKQQIEDLQDCLDRRIQNVNSVMKTMNGYKQKLELITKKIQGLKNECIQLKNFNNSLQTQIKSNMSIESRDISNLKDSVNLSIQYAVNYLNKSTKNEQHKQTEMQRKLEEKENLINELKSKALMFDLEKQKLKEKILSLEAVIVEKEERVKVVQELRKKIKDLERNLEESRSKKLLYQSRLDSFCAEKLNFSGDPLVDMENQRRTNKRKVRALLHENSNLKITINKLKALGSNRISTTTQQSS